MVAKRWQIYWANLDPVVGSEQSGIRPVIIVSANEANLLNQVTVIPLTSCKKDGRKLRKNEAFIEQKHSGLDKDSIALAHQVRTADKRRFIKLVGELHSEQIQQDIILALRRQLEI